MKTAIYHIVHVLLEQVHSACTTSIAFSSGSEVRTFFVSAWLLATIVLFWLCVLSVDMHSDAIVPSIRECANAAIRAPSFTFRILPLFPRVAFAFAISFRCQEFGVKTTYTHSSFLLHQICHIMIQTAGDLWPFAPVHETR